jgi:hypothetical protein
MSSEDMKIEEDSSDESSQDSSFEESDNFTPVPGLDPGKINPALKNMVASVFNQRLNNNTENDSNTNQDNPWKEWVSNENPFDTFNNNPFTQGDTNSPPNEEKDDSVNVQGVIDNAFYLFRDLMKDQSANTTKSDDSYTTMVNAFESIQFSAGNISNKHLRAYFFLEKVYSCYCICMARAKEEYGQKSHIGARVDALGPYFREEFKNALSVILPEDEEDEVD